MEDNVDIFRWFMFEIPGEREMMGVTVALGVVLGVISTWLLSPASTIRANIIGGLIIVLFFYLLPMVLTGEVTSRLGDVTRRWTYFMAVIDQLVLFAFVVIAVVADSILVENVQEAWQLLWLGIATVFMVNVVMVVGARGRQRRWRSVGYALMTPVFLLAAFHIFIGQLVGIPKTLYLQNSVLFLISAVFLFLMIGLYDFLIRANVENLSAADFPSVIILGGEKEISGGITTEVYHQVLHVKQDAGDELRYNIPWVHPGPVEGFGGGRLTEKLIDDDTFFLHIPSDHSLDLASPEDIGMFADMPEAQLHDTATKLVSVERDGFTLWGRRYGDSESGRSIVYVQNRELDDYDPGIISELKNRYENVCLIDLHNQPLHCNNPRLQSIDARTQDLREAMEELMETLDEAKAYEYSAGFAGEKDYRCLVESVRDQRTVSEQNGDRTLSSGIDGVQEVCILGIDGNDAPQVLFDAENELRSRFDETLVYTTDSHKRLIELASPKQYTFDKLVEAAETARETASSATAGIGETQKQVDVLGEQYGGLIFTLNLMARLVPITLVLYYIVIVLLVL